MSKAIPVKCQCGSAYQVKAAMAGKRARCPKCREVIVVPSLASPPSEIRPSSTTAKSAATARRSQTAKQPSAATRAPADPATSPQSANPETAAVGTRLVTPQQISQAFAGDIQPVKPSLAYRLGIVLVTGVMVLLPLIYVGFIALLCWGIYWHLTQDVGMLSWGGGSRGRALVLLAYIAPAIVGPIAIVFMIKPLFARPARREFSRSLMREAEPTLFAFVDRICQAVHAPKPRRINVDCDVNASASFRSGITSMLRGSDLVLTVGMPLVAGMNMRQFGGVLAHEFGHFSQGAGMRLTYIIRSINAWFARVVYERDSWDEQLSALAEGLDIRVGWVLYLSMAMVWVTRQLLWCLMMAGHVMAGFMLRQMEFDADRHEARLAGSESFAGTCRRLNELGLAYQAAQNDLQQFYREGRLADDLPKLMMANVARLPKEAQQFIDERVAESTTGWFDTHPADRDRIENARAEKVGGVFRVERPAADLFGHYAATCQNVTVDTYRSYFGPRLKKESLHSTDKLLARQTVERADASVIQRYFLDGYHELRGVALPSAFVSAPENPSATLNELKQVRQAIVKQVASHRNHLVAFNQIMTEVVQAETAVCLHRGHCLSRKMEFTVPVANLDQAKHSARAALARKEQRNEQLKPFEQLCGRRLGAALQLLHVDQVSARIEGAADQQRELASMLETYSLMQRFLSRMSELQTLIGKLAVMSSLAAAQSHNEDFVSELIDETRSLAKLLAQFRPPLRGGQYPFDHAQGKVSLAKYLMGDTPSPDDLGAIYGCGCHLLEQFPELYARIVTRLAKTAETVETAIGLKPLSAEAPVA